MSQTLSRLGLGCMRFPPKAGGIDQERAESVVGAAFDAGVNYYDTAYIYPGNEAALGKALRGLGLRDRVNIATKLPLFLTSKTADLDRLFQKQLERLQTDHVEYYLLHMLCDVPSWERLAGLGIERWIAEKKAAGAIQNIGFSYHGGLLEFPKVVDAYGWDFCMVQYNYLDEHRQAGRSGVRYAAGKGLPVFCMEPLRGGRLVRDLPEAAQKAFAQENPERSAADWALRWLWNQPEVAMVLSGMTDPAEVRHNAAVLADAAPGHLSPEELRAIEAARAAIEGSVKVPCTGCGYCLPCPKGVDIPSCFTAYNQSYREGLTKALRAYMQTTGAISATQTYASRCVRCRKCESHCPQGIVISEEIQKAAKRLEPFWFKPGFALARKVLGVKGQ